MASKSELISLHKYFLNAEEMRNHFLRICASKKTPENLSESVEHMIYLSLWYGCLRVVIEGWQSLKLTNESVDRLMDETKISHLNGFRNDVFHFKSEYYAKRSQKVFTEQGFVKWVHEIHIGLGDQMLKMVKE